MIVAPRDVPAYNLDMRAYASRFRSFGAKLLTVLVLFAVARLAFGIVAIAFLSDDGLAYSLRATLILALAAVVATAVALVVRHRWSAGT